MLFCQHSGYHAGHQHRLGRKLDFLSQEFNREANTLCSKAQNKALTATGLELKTVIDQMREQARHWQSMVDKQRSDLNITKCGKGKGVASSASYKPYGPYSGSSAGGALMAHAS